MLMIKGEVVPREKTVEEVFTWPVGPVRFESNHLAFTTLNKNEKRIRVMRLKNTSKTAAKVEFEPTPEHLSLKIKPETLQPGQEGVVEGTYDATKNTGYGNVNDLVRVRINGEVVENGYYYVSANLLEDFSKLTKEELANPPVAKFLASTVDIGSMDPATAKDVEFKFTNEGKRDLIIRSIKSTCGCTAVKEGGNLTVKPGESGTIKATFNSGSYKGKVTKAIYVYTNDPKNSEVLLMLNADVAGKGQ
jgi:hypothetical protein